MFDKDRILFQLSRTRVFTLQMIDRIDHKRWFEMPMGITHVAWNVGHIAIAEYFLGLCLVRGERDSDSAVIPETFRGLFGYGSEVSADPTVYPSPDELRLVLKQVHDQVILETEEMSDEALMEPCVFNDPEFDHHPIFTRRGGALEWLTHHEHIHIGQLGLLRRMLGENPIEYLDESRAGKDFVSSE